jgi:hypothetical protein
MEPEKGLQQSGRDSVPDTFPRHINDRPRFQSKPMGQLGVSHFLSEAKEGIP